MIKTTTLTLALLLSASSLAWAALPAVDAATPAQVQGETREAKRSKERVPGGSGCDSAHDMAEHAQCRS
jgi:hypothetical protein